MGQFEATSLWEQVCEGLSVRKETSNPMVEAFLSNLVPKDLDESTLTMSTRLVFVKQWTENRYLPFIDEAIVDTLGSRRRVRIIITDEEQPVRPPKKATQPLSNQATTAASFYPVSQAPAPPPIDPLPPTLPTSSHPAPPLSSPTLSTAMPSVTAALTSSADTQPEQDWPADHSKKTFETFVVGASNDFAFSAAQGVAEMPGKRFNPLFIYGRSGLGKTHLLLAIQDYIKRYHPTRRVLFVQTSEFVNDFTSAMASINKDLTDFRIKYHMCDVLLLDDVQYLEGKESTTNALFDIFNQFIAQHKQIVLSADRAPNELNLDERFASRFAQGLTAGIQPPSFEMKMAIFNNLIKYYCQQFGMEEVAIPQEVADHIIELSSSNIRELEGATSTIVSYIAHRRNDIRRNSPITVEEAEQIVGKVFLHSNMKQIDIRSIQKEVAAYFNINPADMTGSRRSKNISYPRQVAMYLSRRLTTKSFPEIGKAFGGKDHTSVLYAYRNIEQKIMEDINRKIEVERLAEMILS